jgi:hypothetical protein
METLKTQQKRLAALSAGRTADIWIRSPPIDPYRLFLAATL